MATQARARGGGAGASRGVVTASGVGLRILSVMLGVFFVALSLTKIAWLADPGILRTQLQQWLMKAAPAARWYLETVCLPGVPLFARLVPLGEFSAGLALVAGFWTRMAAIVACLMVVSFHFAASDFWSPSFLKDGYGLPVLGGLLAIAIGGSKLPFSASK
jgi:uncharacterized membrane protein YphA (DoxX/SURF4 family)